MKLKIEITNYRKLIKNDIETEQIIRQVSNVCIGQLLDFHSIEPFNKNINETNEIFLVKNITKDCVELEVINAMGSCVLLNNEAIKTEESAIYTLTLNKTLSIDDSFNNIYSFITLRILNT